MLPHRNFTTLRRCAFLPTHCVRCVLLVFPILLVEYQLPEIGQFLRMFFSFLFQFFDVLLALLDLTGRCMRCLAEPVVFLTVLDAALDQVVYSRIYFSIVTNRNSA